MAASQLVLRKPAASSSGSQQSLHQRLGTAGEASLGSSSNSETPVLPPAERPKASLTYSSLRVDVKDPLSSSKPLRPFDRTTFESAFPSSPAASTTSTTTSPVRSFSAPASALTSAASSSAAYSPRADPAEDPFFYPLLPGNERKRLAEFWFLTAGIHDDISLAKHLQNLLTLVRDLYGFDIALLQFIDNDRSSSLSPDGWQSSCYPRRETGCAHTMLLEPGVSFCYIAPRCFPDKSASNRPSSWICLSQTVLNIDDFSEDWRFAANPQISSAQMCSYAGVPLAYTVQSTG